MEWLFVILGYTSAFFAFRNWKINKDNLASTETFALMFISSLYVYWNLYEVAISSRVILGRLAFLALLFTILLRMIDLSVRRGKRVNS